MKLKDLPDFAKKYKKKGYDVRKVLNSYQLFKITSKRIKGKNHPVLISDYIGTIDKEKGLIAKKTFNNENKVEYGLSHFILEHFNRKLIRSLFNQSNGQGLVYLAIIDFMYGYHSDRFINLTYLSKFKNIMETFLGDSFKKRIEALSKRIEKELNSLIKNKEDLTYLLILLIDIKVSKDEENIKINYSEDIKNLLRKYKIKYE